jgi:hypothetical protein
VLLCMMQKRSCSSSTSTGLPWFAYLCTATTQHKQGGVCYDAEALLLIQHIHRLPLVHVFLHSNHTA